MTQQTPIYLDYAATTPVDETVVAKMAQCLSINGTFGNPSSRSHRYGWEAEQAVEQARRQVAEVIHAKARDIIWTSGATESNNLAILGSCLDLLHTNKPVHIISSVIEHKAVIDPIKYLEDLGAKVSWLVPNQYGVISAQQVADALQEDTRLVSLMAVNNEIGSINPIAQIGALLAANKQTLLHVDAVQAAGKIVIDIEAWQVDMLSLSAHKCYGPKGIGALFVRPQAALQLTPVQLGGMQERRLRAGTLATHQIVGFGAAFALLKEHFDVDTAQITQLRNRLWQGIKELPNISLNGQFDCMSGHHLNVNFEGIGSDLLIASLDKLAFSSGSACNSATVEPSHVLKGIGLSDALAHTGVRFSLGRYTTAADIDCAISEIKRVTGALLAST